MGVSSELKHFSSHAGKTCCGVPGLSLQQAQHRVLQVPSTDILCCTKLGTALPRGSPAFAKALQAPETGSQRGTSLDGTETKMSCTERVGAQLLLSWL